MATKSIEQPGLLKFYRGRGFGLSTSGADLPDNDAEVSFLKLLTGKSLMKVYFGYHSLSGKEYKRDLNLDIHQVIQLRDLLNKCIDSQAIENNTSG